MNKRFTSALRSLKSCSSIFVAATAAAALRASALGLFLGPQEAPKRGLDFLGRRQDRVLVGRDQFLGPGILEVDVIHEAAVVEDVP